MERLPEYNTKVELPLVTLEEAFWERFNLPPEIFVKIQSLACSKYHPDGSLRSICSFKKSKKHGPEKHWYLGGTLKYEINWKEGKKHGLENDRMLGCEINWKEGKKHGVEKWWHDNGTLHMEIHWEEGKMHGMVKIWHKNGTLYRERNWKEGV
ncbi:MAG: toxin-antitoxin system YwqK family antitoxin [Promethearchaeota archaeon]